MGLGIAKGVTGGVLGKSPVGKIVAGSLNGAQFAANAGLGIAGGVTRGVLGSEEDFMSMYGDHTDMLMGGDLNDQMIFGAGNDEDLRFSFKKIGRGLKKAAKSKIGKEIIRHGKKAAIDYAKRRAGLGEEDFMSMYGDHSSEPGMLMGDYMNNGMIMGVGREYDF